jgi:hypothetical protein
MHFLRRSCPRFFKARVYAVIERFTADVIELLIHTGVFGELRVWINLSKPWENPRGCGNRQVRLECEIIKLCFSRPR